MSDSSIKDQMARGEETEGSEGVYNWARSISKYVKDTVSVLCRLGMKSKPAHSSFLEEDDVRRLHY